MCACEMNESLGVMYGNVTRGGHSLCCKLLGKMAYSHGPLKFLSSFNSARFSKHEMQMRKPLKELTLKIRRNAVSERVKVK